MYKLYKRVQKTKEYMYGIKTIENDENPFLEGPCLLCISAQLDNSYAKKSNFGIVKQGMQMSRMRVRGSINAGFDINEFPVNFLAIEIDNQGKGRTMEKEERTKVFVDKYLVPLISDNGKRIDTNKAMKNMRNVNMLSYCDGTVAIQNMEENLVSRMQEIGYTNEECIKIQSQMCMIPISTDRLSGTQKSTCISFKDIYDDEVCDNVTQEEQQAVEESQIKERIIKYSNNEIAYLFAGDGEHDLKKYTQAGIAMSVCLSDVVSRVLQNSIENYLNPNFVPINVQELTGNMEAIMQKAEEGSSREDLMQELDSNLEYEGANKISNLEAQLLDMLDESYDSQILMQAELARVKRDLGKAEEKLNQTDEAIKANCTETTYKKIIASRGFQFSREEEQKIKEAPSDKSLILSMQKVLENAVHQGVSTKDVEESKSINDKSAVSRDEQ